MKNVLLGSLAFALVLMGGNVWGQSQTVKKDTTEKAAPAPFEGKIQFKKESIDFGSTKLNKPVTVKFEFTNISNAPVIIQNAQPSCGCTTPDWTKEPVLPGKKGMIKATYNASSLGHQSKTVFVNFKGIPSTLELHLTGKVEK